MRQGLPRSQGGKPSSPHDADRPAASSGQGRERGWSTPCLTVGPPLFRPGSPQQTLDFPVPNFPSGLSEGLVSCGRLWSPPRNRWVSSVASRSSNRILRLSCPPAPRAGLSGPCPHPSCWQRPAADLAADLAAGPGGLRPGGQLRLPQPGSRTVTQPLLHSASPCPQWALKTPDPCSHPLVGHLLDSVVAVVAPAPESDPPSCWLHTTGSGPCRPPTPVGALLTSALLSLESSSLIPSAILAFASFPG